MLDWAENTRTDSGTEYEDLCSFLGSAYQWCHGKNRQRVNGRMLSLFRKGNLT